MRVTQFDMIPSYMIKASRALFRRNCTKALALSICIAALTSHSAFAVQTDVEVDPWEGMNRKIYQFNDVADRYFLKPVAKAYDKITPQFMNNGITRFFKNLGEPASAINALLQGKPVNSSKNLGRFILNTTVGVVGVMDIATKVGLHAEKEDFGQTLAVWGFDSGPYVMLPFMGPSTIRGATGKIPGIYTNPVHYIDHTQTRYSFTATELIDLRADLLSAEKLISGDQYTFIRDAYLQRRAYDINDGDIEDSFEDDFGDFDDEEDFDE